MSTNPLRLAALLRKYIDNTIAPPELEEFWQLMSELSDNDLVSLNLQSLWNGQQQLSGDGAKEDWNIAYSRLQKRIEKIQLQEVTPSRKNIPLRSILAAAVILLVIASAIWILIPRKTEPAEPFSDITSLASVKKPVRTIMLPDESVVTLRDGSLLQQVSFTGKTREVYLDGEAFFDVKRNPGKPFIVRTNRYNTIVLGTAFNLHTDSSSKKFTLTVTKGKVRVEEGASKKAIGTVTPEQQLTIDYSTIAQTSLRNKVATKQILEWTRQDLIFENSNWDSASKEINKRFGVALKFTNEKMLRCRFSGDFTDKTLNECLDILCALTNARWKKEGMEIKIDGNACE